MTTTLSTHQGLLTKACNRLSSVLREEAGVIDIANQLPVNSEETREYLKNQRQQLRKARLALETGIAGVEKALEKYSMAADGLDPDTPSLSDIIEKVEANSETAQKLLDSAIGKLSQLIGVQDELEVDNQPFTTEGAPQVALPPIPIPKFSGKIWEWETFWGAFNHSVHSRSMDDLYKMNYLVDALQGEAKECIKHYEVSRATYPAVVAYLHEKYGNKEVLIDKLLQRLQTAKATSDRLGDQELLCERLNSLVSQLELKGEHVNNVFLQKQLLGKFSTEVQRHVLRQQHLSGAKWETKSLLAFAREYIRTEMQIIQHTGKPIREEPSVGTSNKETRRQTPKIAKPPFTCFYCNKTGHSPRECDEVPTREQRMEVIRKKNLCRNCGANDHHMSQCKRGACRICNEVGHHTSTCRGAVFSKEKQQMRVPQTQAKPPRTSKGVAQHSPGKTTKAAATRAHSVTAEELSTEQLTPDTVLHLTNDHRESHSLILIGQALVFNPLSQKLEKIHVVLDSGADRSFISSALADRLQLPETEQSVLKINTFGSSSPMTKRCSTTTVKLWDRDGLPHSYTVTKIDILTEPVQSSLLTQEDKRFLCDNNISLSISPNAENIQPDVLLGCADLFTLLEKDVGKQQILPSGLKVLPSRLGHLVIGRTNAETGRDQSSVNVSRSTNAEHQDAMGCEGSNCSHRGPQQTNHRMAEERSDTEDLDRTPIDDSDSTTPTKGKSSQTGISLLNSADQKEGEACDNPQAEMWEQFFAFETYGVREFTGPAAKERDDINALVRKEFNETIKQKEDGYYVRLPWKTESANLPDNKAMSFRRLETTVAKLQKDPQLFKEYHKTFMQQLQLGVIEEVKDAESTTGIVHYLPHQAVLTPHKETTKLRVVFDASAHMKGHPSLNDVLHQGPVILPRLVDLLLRFRVGSIAIIGDVEKAFLQVRLQPQDRDATRFLWLRDITLPVTTDNLITYRFTRVTFGLNCSPFLLAGTIQYHLESHRNRQFAKTLSENIYVDNVILTSESNEDALHIYKQAKNIFGELRMNLREFRSNSSHFNDSVRNEDLSSKLIQKVLGVQWDTNSDAIVLECSYPEKQRCTKRTVSEQVASIYDPHGWLTPLTLHGKLFFQELWLHDYKWDSCLSQEHQFKWEEIRSNVNGFYKQVGRKVGIQNQPATLVLFSDASAQAMATCAYIVQQKHSCLLVGKCKLPRIKEKPTIPKMELHALTMAARLSRSILDALQTKLSINVIYILTDSEIALSWVTSPNKDKSAGVYVGNRVKEIRDIVQSIPIPVMFGYASTSANAADCATRGLGKDEIQEHLWWTGPSFIVEPPDQWNNSCRIIPIDEKEDNQDDTAVTFATNSISPSSEILEWKRFKSIDSCTAALAYALRFVKALSSRATPELRSRIEEHIPEASHMVNEAYITAAERKLALQVLLRNHQMVHFPTSRKNVLKQLKLQTDKQGILRCRGRLEKSGLPFDARQPVLIAAKSDLARLIVRQAHMPFHCGVSHTIANVRQNYWIPKLRQLTKSLIRTCVPCQKMNNIPYAYPDMQDLPECRVRKSRPFNHVGIDFFGPITAKENEVLKKVYGLIITCTTTRLLHLELTEDMSTTAVLLALRRFFARRGVPSTIISDNAPSFVLGNEVLRDTITSTPSSESLEKTMATKGITWKTITPYAPWQGAFYERLIKSVKQSLFKVIRGCTLEKEVLETLLIEIEGCLNSRPLTYQEEKWDETPILRPIDFLQRDIIVTYPFDFIQEEGDDEEYLPSEEALLLRTRRQAEEALRNSHQYTEQFWKIWSRDYISGLREKHILCLKGKNGTKTIPKVGTVVLVVDELLPRNSWKVGRITGLRTAQDGVIREAEVKTPNGRLIRRPVNLLVPLELNDTDDPLEASDQESSSDESCPIPKGEKKAEEGAQDNSRHQRYNLRPRITNQGVRSASQKSTAGHIYLALMAMTLVMVLGVNGESGPNPKGTRFENQTTKMHCIPGGVRLTSTKATRYEICAEHHCQVKENPPNEEEVSFPPEITVLRYHVLWKVHDGSHLTILDTECEASSFCDHIHCWFCTANIFNPECSPRSAIAATAAVLYVMTALIYVLCYVPVTVGKPCRLICRGLGRIAVLAWRAVRCMWHRGARRLLLRRQNRRHNVEALLRAPLIMAVAAAVMSAQGCQNVDVFSQPTTVCTISPLGKKTCRSETTEILKINSFHQEACVRLLHNQTLVKELRATWKGLQLTCTKQDVVFSRDTVERVQDSKRCAHSGSCVGTKCQGINTTALLPELQESNQYPGETHCVESCGGPGCGCFYWSSGCLFYRIYSRPRNDRVYEIFKCGQWKEEVKLEISTIQGLAQEQHRQVVSLQPSIPQRIGSMRIILSSVTIPPTPALSSHFISDGENVAIWEESRRPTLQCESISTARALNCTVSPSCSCQPAENTVNCACADVSITEVFERRIENRLPVRRPWVSFSQADPDRTTVTATIPMLTTAEILVHLERKV